MGRRRVKGLSKGFAMLVLTLSGAPGRHFAQLHAGQVEDKAVVGGAQPLAQATDAGSPVLHDAWGQNCRGVSAPPRCPPGQGADQGGVLGPVLSV